jgi:transposase-like protein
MKRRARVTAEQRQKVLADFQSSGLTVTEFARRNGLSRPLLSVWLRRYVRPPGKGARPTESSTELPLQEVSLNQVLGQPAWAAEVVLRSGLTVRLDGPGRDHLLAHLLVGRPGC